MMLDEIPPDVADDAVARLRVPPHSVEAEQSVLGALMLDNAAWDRIGDVLTEADLYRAEHRLIFGAIAALVQAGKPADVVTVFEALGAQAAGCGGLPHLNDLAQCVPGSGNIRRYAEIVRERAVLRRLIAAIDEIAAAAFNPQGRTVAQVLGEAEAKVMAIGHQGHAARDTSATMGALMVGLLDRVQELADRAGEVVGVPTGFPDLDRDLSGMQPGDLLILAARPSMGKTALALNIAEHVAVSQNLPAIVFSMEMGAQQLAMRMAASVGRINAQAMRNGRLTDDEWGRLAEASDRLSAAPMVIDDASALTVSELRSRARRLARTLGGVSLVVIDYLQLMSGGGSEENRATELGEISRGLKALAKELNCPVLALSQLNRSVESRSDKRPVMSDLRESGAIEQDADVILFIYRDDYYTKDACREPGVAEILIAKQRNGPTGTVRLAWRPVFTRFESLAHDYAPPPYHPPAPRRTKEI